MCLELKVNFKKEIATEDIVVYKTIIEKFFDDKVGLVTPYRYCSVEVGQAYHSDIVIVSDNNCTVGLDSFKYKKDAIYDGKENMFINTHLVKCLIPKGAEYYSGFFISSKAYCSNQITYVEILKTFNKKRKRK